MRIEMLFGEVDLINFAIDNGKGQDSTEKDE